MSDAEQRLIELELRYMEQTDVIEKLNTELVAVNTEVQTLTQRLGRLERQLEDVLRVVDLPVNEKPPHY